MLIKNGIIIDGTKKERYAGDIRVKDGIIESIDHLEPLKGEEVIDAQGLFVTPGFVDIANQSDIYLSLLTQPSLDSLAHQGITSILVGNEGVSLAPLTSPELIATVQKWTDPARTNLNWLSLGEYLQELRNHDLGVNVGTLTGHTTVRRGVLREEFREASDEELRQMLYLFEQSFKEGSFGVSFGLGHSHARPASLIELGEIAKLAKHHDKLCAVHLRDEGEGLLASLEMAISLARMSDVRMEINHLKAVGKNAWPLWRKALEVIAKANETNIDITFDIYPYTKTATPLYTLLPEWAAEGGKEKTLARLRSKEMYTKIAEALAKNMDDFSDSIIAGGKVERTLIGKSVQEVAANQNISPAEAVLRLLMVADGRVVVFTNTIAEDNIALAIQSPQSFIASSGAGERLGYNRQGSLAHPRSFGTFPRFLGYYVRDKKLLTWEEAIYKITWGPAQKMRLQKRGRIAEGFYADMVIIDPKKIKDLATFENPFMYPSGIEHVFIKGNHVLAQGTYMKKDGGSVLTRL